MDQTHQNQDLIQAQQARASFLTNNYDIKNYETNEPFWD